MRCSLKEVVIVLALIAAALSVVVALGEPAVGTLLPGFFGALMLVLGVIAIARGQRERQAQYLRHGETVDARLASQAKRSAAGQKSSGARVYPPKPFRWGLCLILLAFVFLMTVLDGRVPLRSFGGALVYCLIMGLMVLLLYSKDQIWVLLYEDRLEIHGFLRRLLSDRFGLIRITPTIIPYRHIRILQGIGEHGNLVIIQRMPDGRWKEDCVSDVYVENHADLEAELLHRVPTQCILHPDPTRYIQLPGFSKRGKKGSPG